MCVDTSRVQLPIGDSKHSPKFSTSYSIKKAIKTIFKKYTLKTASSSESLESMDNLRNSQVEDYSTEIEENAANERLLADYEGYNDDDTDGDDLKQFLIPVKCIQTSSGTFFWTTASHPADKDLVQPMQCYSQNQIAELQRHDRWAQA